MLPRPKRIVKQKDFDFIYKTGRTLKSPLMKIKFIKNGFQYNRFATVVSNKIDKRATVRNKTKRQIRAILKEKDRLISPGRDFIITAQKEITQANFADLESVIADLLARAARN